jgi:hypothetical protein
MLTRVRSIQASAGVVSARPTTEASSARTSASTKSCITIRPRLAPSAVRTTISRSRVAVRANISSATFADTSTRKSAA